MLDTLYNGFAGLVGTLNDLMYSYVLIILLAGLILLLLPSGSRTKAEPAAAQPLAAQTHRRP